MKKMILAPALGTGALGAGVLGTAVEAGGDVLPLAALARETEAAGKSGTFALMGFRGRDTLQLREGIEAGGAGPAWRTPGEAGFGVGKDTLSFHTNGRVDFASRWDWLPVLRWTPSAPGTFALQGTLDLRAGKDSPDAKAPDAVAWALLRFKASGEAEVVAQARRAASGQVLLGEQPALQKIALKRGESLGLTVWRPAWHWNAGGTLSNFAIAPAQR